MKSLWRNKRLSALLLTGALLIGVFSAAVPASAENEDTLYVTQVEGTTLSTDENSETISIRTVEDLLEMAEGCRLDSWSVGKIFVLENDLELDGSGFEPIPSFGGSFRGQGHTISGLSVKGSYAPAGLFAELQACGEIRDLTVTGTVEPAGSSEYVGGIVGRNAGSITNCRFYGTVTGSSCTGGIVGINLSTGRTALCDSE